MVNINRGFQSLVPQTHPTLPQNSFIMQFLGMTFHGLWVFERCFGLLQDTWMAVSEHFSCVSMQVSDSSYLPNFKRAWSKLIYLGSKMLYFHLKLKYFLNMFTCFGFLFLTKKFQPLYLESSQRRFSSQTSSSILYFHHYIISVCTLMNVRTGKIALWVVLVIVLTVPLFLAPM